MALRAGCPTTSRLPRVRLVCRSPCSSLRAGRRTSPLPCSRETGSQAACRQAGGRVAHRGLGVVPRRVPRAVSPAELTRQSTRPNSSTAVCTHDRPVAGEAHRGLDARQAGEDDRISGWSESLRQELLPDVRVPLIEPGVVAIELPNHTSPTAGPRRVCGSSTAEPRSPPTTSRGDRLRPRPAAAPRDPRGTPATGRPAGLISRTTRRTRSHGTSGSTDLRYPTPRPTAPLTSL